MADSDLVLLALDMQTRRFEKLHTLNTFTTHGAVCLYLFLVPLKRRTAEPFGSYDKAFASFAGCTTPASNPVRQLFGLFTVRDGRLVATGEPRVLEHRVRVPTSVDDGQTLLGGVKSETGHCYECLLDVKSGEQRPLRVDSSGRPVASAMDNMYYVRSSEQF